MRVLDLDALAMEAYQDEDALGVYLDHLLELDVVPPYERPQGLHLPPTMEEHRARVAAHQLEMAREDVVCRVTAVFKAHWSREPWRGAPRGYTTLLEPEGARSMISSITPFEIAPGEVFDLVLTCAIPIAIRRIHLGPDNALDSLLVESYRSDLMTEPLTETVPATLLFGFGDPETVDLAGRAHGCRFVLRLRNVGDGVFATRKAAVVYQRSAWADAPTASLDDRRAHVSRLAER